MLQFTDMNVVGFIPQFISEHDERPAKEQINEAYAHGGGWHSFKGFELIYKGDHLELQYPDDPPMQELSRAEFRDELLVFFESSWLAIIQKDGSFDVARLD